MNIGRDTAGALLVALVMVVTPACHRSTSRTEASPPLAEGSPVSPVKAPEPPKAPEASKAPEAPEAPEAGATGRGGAIPAELRADYIHAVQARAAAAYPVVPGAAKVLRARSPAQKLLAELSPEGVRITNEASPGASGGLALTSFGCEKQRVPVRATVPRVEGNRVEYVRGDLLEWYTSGPLGLEQGFTLAAPPPCRAQDGQAVVVELAIRGALHAERVVESTRIELRDSTGREGFTASDLFARDAAGRTLAATMVVQGKRVLLRVHDADAAYPLQIELLISTLRAKLLAKDGADHDMFGRVVAISGDTALVGADRNDGNGVDAGAAYVFVRGGSGWTQQARLTAADGGTNDNFGGAVAVAGDTALVGAIFNSGVRSGGGAAYVFVRSGSSWTQQAKLTAADARSQGQLGVSVALEGDTALVGTVNDSDHGERSGSVYVFVRGGTSWTQQAKLTAADGAALDQFGISVAVSEDTALVGAYGDEDRGRSSGSAYVFVRSGTSWAQQAKLLAADGAAMDKFGVSVAVSGNTALVGAVFSLARSGVAYVFVRDGTSWTQQAKLLAADRPEPDTIGASVAVQGDTALVGVPNDSSRGAESGAAYVFVRRGTTWHLATKLKAVDAESADLFGASVALSGNMALIGGLGDDDLGASSGSAYPFLLVPGPGAAAMPAR